MEDFNWQSLSALNNPPSIWRGLTLNEMFLCLAVSAFLGAGISIPVYSFFLTWLAIPLSVFLCILIFFYPSARFFVFLKNKYGPQMYIIRLKKTIQGLGIADFGLEIQKKKWSVRRSKKYW